MANITSYTKTRLSWIVIIILVFQSLTIHKAFAQEQSATSGVNATINRQVQWKYADSLMSVELLLDENIYNYYKGLSKKEPKPNYAQEFDSHPYLLNVARQLDEDAKALGYSGFQMAEYLTTFVQQTIKYQSDPYNDGWDYPKYPIETLMEKAGDCEDSAVLLVSLLKTFGFDAVLISLPRHFAVGIVCETCDSFYNYKGKKYAYIETTYPNWLIGSVPNEVSGIEPTLLETSPLVKYNRNSNSTTNTIGKTD